MFDYAKATAIAVVMLVVSFVLLLTINVLQWWTNRYNTTTSHDARRDHISCAASSRASPHDQRTAVRCGGCSSASRWCF